MAARRFAARNLERDVTTIFLAAGSAPPEAAAIAKRLVDANLVGHDSHGVIRAPRYIRDLSLGGVVANQHATIVLDTPALVVMDGNNGFGQVIGAEAMAVGIARARRHGACALALRHSAHLGRIGDWAEMAADAGLASFHFVNVTGQGAARVAPYGGSDARLATNPVAAGIPRPDGIHIILDMATSMVAEGKIAVAANRGVETPEGWLIDAHGRPTRDPARLYADPPGAIMPFGLYKGYGLSLFCDLFAGALIGAGSIASGHTVAARIENNMVSFLVDPAAIGDRAAFEAEVEAIVAFVGGSPPADPGKPILMPGDAERQTREERLRLGIPLEDRTWEQLCAAAESVGVAANALLGP